MLATNVSESALVADTVSFYEVGVSAPPRVHRPSSLACSGLLLGAGRLLQVDEPVPVRVCKEKHTRFPVKVYHLVVVKRASRVAQGASATSASLVLSRTATGISLSGGNKTRPTLEQGGTTSTNLAPTKVVIRQGGRPIERRRATTPLKAQR